MTMRVNDSHADTQDGWPIFKYGGKTYATNKYREVLVWRLASRRTGRHHWVSVRTPPAPVAEWAAKLETVS